MKKSLPTKNAFNKYRKCPCPAAVGKLKKWDRVPLCDIQDSAQRNQNLKAECPTQEKPSVRSKSLSQISPSVKVSSATSKISTESTRIQPKPRLKKNDAIIYPTTIKPNPVESESKLKTEPKKPLLQRTPVQSKSTTTKASKSATSESNKKINIQLGSAKLRTAQNLQNNDNSSRRKSEQQVREVPVVKINSKDSLTQKRCSAPSSSTIPVTSKQNNASVPIKTTPKLQQYLESEKENLLRPKLLAFTTKSHQGQKITPKRSSSLKITSTKYSELNRLPNSSTKTNLLSTAVNSFQNSTAVKDGSSSTRKSSSSATVAKDQSSSVKSNIFPPAVKKQLPSSSTKLSQNSTAAKNEPSNCDASLSAILPISQLSSIKPTTTVTGQSLISTKSYPHPIALKETARASSVISSQQSITPEQSTNLLARFTSKSATSSQHSTISKEVTRSSATSTVTTVDDPQKYTTLPSQHFVTLTQDTLKITISSDFFDVASITNALGNVNVLRDSSIFAQEDKTFVDGLEFFQDLEQGKVPKITTIPVCSPVTLNVPVRRSNSLNEAEAGKRVKTTLRRKSSTKKAVDFPLGYSPEYLEDIISYSYKNRNNFLLHSGWIEGYIDKRCRTFIINWLLQVTELILPNFDPVYYMAVRIFDISVIKLNLRKGYYQLAGMVAYWISMKYLDNNVLLKVPKIYSLCNGQYSKSQILSMERKILKAMNFCLNVSDPLDFLHSYLKSFNLETNELLKYGSKFVMECTTLFESYPKMEAPLIAASALYLAHKVLINKPDVHWNFIWLKTKDIQKYADSVLVQNVKYAVAEKYEPLNKYSTPEKLYVAKHFLSI